MFNPYGCCQMPMPCNQPMMYEAEIIEPVVHQYVEKYYQHEVPHICPKHTHVINKHIYNHTYRPQNSCSEENQIINTGCGSCCNF